MTDLRSRIADAITRVKASRAADEVLDEIATTHVLVPRRLVERAAKAKGIGGGFDRDVISNELAVYWKDSSNVQ